MRVASNVHAWDSFFLLLIYACSTYGRDGIETCSRSTRSSVVTTRDAHTPLGSLERSCLSTVQQRGVLFCLGCSGVVFVARPDFFHNPVALAPPSQPPAQCLRTCVSQHPPPYASLYCSVDTPEPPPILRLLKEGKKSTFFLCSLQQPKEREFTHSLSITEPPSSRNLFFAQRRIF